MATTWSSEQIRRTLDARSDELFAVDGVIGIGVGGSADDAVAHVFCSGELTTAARDQIDRLLDGAPVAVIGMGVPQAHGDDPVEGQT